MWSEGQFQKGIHINLGSGVLWGQTIHFNKEWGIAEITL